MTFEEIREVCAKATLGPWVETRQEDAQFIALARTTLPLLVKVAEAAENLVRDINPTYYKNLASLSDVRAALARVKEAKP